MYSCGFAFGDSYILHFFKMNLANTSTLSVLKLRLALLLNFDREDLPSAGIEPLQTLLNLYATLTARCEPSKELDFLHSSVGITSVTSVTDETITLTQRKRRHKGHPASRPKHGHC